MNTIEVVKTLASIHKAFKKKNREVEDLKNRIRDKGMDISLDMAKAMYQQGGVARKAALKFYPEEQLADGGYPKRWEDLEEVVGRYLSGDSDIVNARGKTSTSNNQNIAPTEKDIVSIRAFCMLRQLAHNLNGGWEPQLDDERWTVTVDKKGFLHIFPFYSESCLIPFKTKDMARFNLRNNEDLWKQYYKIS